MAKNHYLLFTLYLIISVIFINNVFGEKIDPSSEDSPIKKTFTKKIIVWRFDDMSMRSQDTKIYKFLSMTENITKYGGYVGWGFIVGMNETIRYSSPKNLTYQQQNIDKLKALTSDEKVFLWLHCWNHSWYTGTDGPSVWIKSIEQQRDALNYTIWTFQNNFGYYPPIFSAGGSQGNINTTIVLAERDMLLLYGGPNYEPPDKKLRYLTLPSDKGSVLFQLDYQAKKNITDDMKATFSEKYNKYPILQIMLHPGEWNESTLPKFAEFTEWVYTTHNVLNMNFTDAYNYKHDVESIQLDKHNNASYTISLKDALNPLEITWSKQGDWIVGFSHNQTIYGNLNVSSTPESFTLQPGSEFTIRLVSSVISSNDDSTDNTPGFEVIITFCALILFLFFLKRRSVNN